MSERNPAVLAPAVQQPPSVLDVDRKYRLSRHVAIRPTPDGLIAESAATGQRYALASSTMRRLVLAFADPVRLGDLLDAVGGAQRPAVLRFAEQWAEDGLLTGVDDDGTADEDRGPWAHWEFHDLLFHTRSRRGRAPGKVGATWHWRGVVPQDPAIKEPPPPESDVPLTRVLEERRSRYGGGRLELASLGEFLFRTFRVTDRRSAAIIGEAVRKVYPSGGSLHSLEMYVVAWDCGGLERGVYHYRGDQHVLVPVAGASREVELLLEEARTGTGNQLPGYPPVLLVLTARFQRVMWKYQALSYRVIMAELGGLYQTMYLVATAMGLSPTAVGTGDSDRFARITGLDYYREASVGEFVLGGPAPTG
jgi:SagB-type dehydrogenase family enzyme